MGVKWFQQHKVNEPTETEEKLFEIKDCLTVAQANQRHIQNELEVIAVKAFDNDSLRPEYEKQKDNLDKLQDKIEMLEFALNGAVRAQHEEKQSSERVRRDKFQKHWREAIQKMRFENEQIYDDQIKRFEREGNSAQADIWRREKAKLRGNLERRIR